MATPYKIHIDAYDGPLDLLLDLIRKQEMDIHNIPIAKITGQYLEYLHKLEDLDMDVSADFIYMAATLILIKSKMLLPPDPLAGPEEQTIPAPIWCTASSSTRSSRAPRSCSIRSSSSKRTCGPSPIFRSTKAKDTQGELVVSLVDLVRVFQQVLERRKEVAQDRAAPRYLDRRAHDGGAARSSCLPPRRASSWPRFSSPAPRARP